jgi:hypothetical protein
MPSSQNRRAIIRQSTRPDQTGRKSDMVGSRWPTPEAAFTPLVDRYPAFELLPK